MIDTSEFVGIVSQLDVDVARADEADPSSPARIDLCESIGDPDDQRFGTIGPVLVATNLATHHVQGGVDPELARCASFRQARSIPADVSISELPWFDELVASADEHLAVCADR